jgi:DNA integrity scanning protein DisA with diadenylate cyclase activity
LLSAACILPVSKDQHIPKHYGLRHRAALGLAEKTDALCIVVSEETGKVSIAHDSKISTIKLSALEEQLHNNDNQYR